MVFPTLVRAEVAGVLSRTTRNPEFARRASRFGFLATHLVFVDLDKRMAEEAAEIAAAAPMKGADAVFVAVARRYDAVLVSLDRDHLERSPQGVTVCDPLEALDLSDTP